MINQKKLAPYIFIIPFLIMFLIFWIWPIIQSFRISLTDWDGFTPSKFIGFENYLKLLKDNNFITALKNTVLAALVYLVFVVVLSLILGIFLGLMDLRFRNFFRTSYFLPVTMSLVVVATIFQLIYSRTGGLLNNNILKLLNLPPVDWLGNSKLALWSIVGLRVWRNTGYYSIFIIAGLQNIPKNLYEAAMVDGATMWDCIKRITLPLLRPMILYVIVVSSIWAFQLFDEPWVLTKGGPANATLTMAMILYRNSFKYYKLGYGAAISYILTLLMIIFSLIQMRVFRRR